MKINWNFDVCHAAVNLCQFVYVESSKRVLLITSIDPDSSLEADSYPPDQGIFRL